MLHPAVPRSSRSERVALLKAKDERSRKVIMTGRLVMRTFRQGVELGQTGTAGIAVTV